MINRSCLWPSPALLRQIPLGSGENTQIASPWGGINVSLSTFHSKWTTSTPKNTFHSKRSDNRFRGASNSPNRTHRSSFGIKVVPRVHRGRGMWRVRMLEHPVGTLYSISRLTVCAIVWPAVRKHFVWKLSDGPHGAISTSKPLLWNQFCLPIPSTPSR